MVIDNNSITSGSVYSICIYNIFTTIRNIIWQIDYSIRMYTSICTNNHNISRTSEILFLYCYTDNILYTFYLYKILSTISNITDLLRKNDMFCLVKRNIYQLSIHLLFFLCQDREWDANQNEYIQKSFHNTKPTKILITHNNTIQAINPNSNPFKSENSHPNFTRLIHSL